MSYIRHFELQTYENRKNKKFSTLIYLCLGQESVYSSVSEALKKPYIFTQHRGHGIYLAHGGNPEKLIDELIGLESGTNKGMGGSPTIFDRKIGMYGHVGLIGDQAPVAAGFSLIKKNRKVVCYFGDGAANQGQVYEAYNMASLWKLPIIFCIENNQYGMGTSTKRASAGTDLSKHGESFGIPGFAVDGMNPISVYLAGLKAVKWVREGNGPIIMEMKTYRYRGHSMSDPAKYRSREEVQKMREEQDPIEYIKVQLLNKKIFNDDDLRNIDNDIRLEISELAEKATEAELSNEEELYNNVLSV